MNIGDTEQIPLKVSNSSECWTKQNTDGKKRIFQVSLLRACLIPIWEHRANSSHLLWAELQQVEQRDKPSAGRAVCAGSPGHSQPQHSPAVPGARSALAPCSPQQVTRVPWHWLPFLCPGTAGGGMHRRALPGADESVPWGFTGSVPHHLSSGPLPALLRFWEPQRRGDMWPWQHRAVWQRGAQ